MIHRLRVSASEVYRSEKSQVGGGTNGNIWGLGIQGELVYLCLRVAKSFALPRVFSSQLEHGATTQACLPTRLTD